MTWLAVFAALLLVQKWQFRAWNTSKVLGQLEYVETDWQVVHRYVSSAAASISMTVVLFGVAWRRRGIVVPSQPGHWLAIFNAVVYLSFLCTQALSLKIEAAADKAEQNDLAMLGLLFMLVWAGGLASVSLCLAVLRKNDKQWRAVYLLIALLMGLIILPVLEIFLPMSGRNGLLFGAIEPITFRQYAPLVVSGSLLVFIIQCAATDLLHERRRDWPHWLSVAAYLVALALTLADHVMLL
jgi:hypothetical protein